MGGGRGMTAGQYRVASPNKHPQKKPLTSLHRSSEPWRPAPVSATWLTLPQSEGAHERNMCIYRGAVTWTVWEMDGRTKIKGHTAWYSALMNPTCRRLTNRIISSLWIKDSLPSGSSHNAKACQSYQAVEGREKKNHVWLRRPHVNVESAGGEKKKQRRRATGQQEFVLSMWHSRSERIFLEATFGAPAVKL